MKPSTTRILLPVTLDAGFKHSSEIAMNIANDTGAAITLAVIDDDSPLYKIAPLPFHEKEFVHTVTHSEETPNGAVNGLAAKFLTEALDEGIDASEVMATGHSATQLLLISRFHDLLIMSQRARFAIRDESEKRRADPILEVLDQTVIPVLMCGQFSPTEIKSAAVFFDGGPCATMALHRFAALFSHASNIPVVICVSFIEESIARALAREAGRFLISKGFTDIQIEYSEKEPLEAVISNSFTRTDLVAMGIRSRTMFHDLRVGILAKHFLEAESETNYLFC